jgi:hypothetical protein
MCRREAIDRLLGAIPSIIGGSPWVLGAVLLGFAGLCGCIPQQAVLHSTDDAEREGDHYHVETLGEKCAVGDALPMPVGGVGLVVGLEGTGGDCPPDEYRAMLEKDLLKDKVRDVKGEMTSPRNAMVMITGQIPPGASKDDRIDLEISLPHGSRVTSLRGGYLRKCLLYNYDYAKRLRPDFNGPNGMLLGHPHVEAQGLLLVGLGDGDESVRVKHGRIWGGGRVLAPSPFSLVMNADQQYARVTALLADRINQTFQAGFAGNPGTSVAAARDKVGIMLRVPPQYRLNTPRFLRVVRLIPMTDAVDVPSTKGADHRSYRQKLADDLLDPRRTVTAALRLEALGQNSKPALKKGLESAHPLVRFCSAEALAYLGDPSCGEELAAAVAAQPALRAFGLAAMASLDEAICHVKLRELLQGAKDDETRYGAFRALRSLNENDPLVRGELLNEAFWLHRVASAAAPLAHISTTRRAEIVLFGEVPQLKPPISAIAGEFVVTASADDSRCTISRVPLHGAPSRQQCSLELDKVLHTMADMGADYPEVVTLLQQADSCSALTCRVRTDALPQNVSVYDLVKLGQKKAGEELDVELIPAGQDLGLTPTLFDTGLPSNMSLGRPQRTRLNDDKQPGGEPPANLEQ